MAKKTVSKGGRKKSARRKAPRSNGAGEPEADAWMHCMNQALDDQEMPDDFREYLRQRFTAVANHMRNR